MHRCLQNRAVLLEIAQYVDHWVTNARMWGSTRDLLSVALTCRAFCDPTLDVLWRELTDPKVLVLLLPEDDLRFTLPEDGLILILYSAPSDRAWAKFKRFARCVRDVTITNTAVDWCSVKRFYPGDKLLPNLRSLSCQNDFMSCYLPLFISPSLETLYVIMETTRTVDVLAECLSQCGNSVKSLALLSWDQSAIDLYVENSLALSDAMSSFTRLQQCQINTFSSSTLCCLASLSHLKKLAIELPDHILAVSTPLPFPALESLRITYWKWRPTLIAKFLERISAPIINKLHILAGLGYDCEDETERHIPPSALQNLLALASKFPTLRNFYLRPHVVIQDLPQGGLPALQQLFAVRQLESFVVRKAAFALRAEELRTVADAWPAIRTLRLGDDVTIAKGEPVAELEDLLLFSGRLPCLTTLGVRAVVSDDRTYSERRLPFGRSASRVKVLHFGVLAKGEYQEAGAFLACLFPHAKVSIEAELEEDLGPDDEVEVEPRESFGAKEEINSVVHHVFDLMKRVGIHPHSAHP